MKIFNAKKKWNQIQKIARSTKVPGYSANELRKMAREYNSKLPKGSKKRIDANQSAEKLAEVMGIDTKGEPIANLDVKGQRKSRVVKEGFRDQVRRAAKSLTINNNISSPEIDVSVPKEVVDGLVEAVYLKKKSNKKSKKNENKQSPTKGKVGIESYPQFPSLPSNYSDRNPTEEQKTQRLEYRQKVDNRNAAIEEIKRRNYQRVIEHGQKEIQSIAIKLNEARANKERKKEEMDRHIDYLAEQFWAELKPVPDNEQVKLGNLKADYHHAAQKYDDIANESFEACRQNLFKSSVTEKDSQDYVESVKYSPSLKKSFRGEYRTEDLRKDLASIYQMCGGKITTLKQVEFTNDRADANPKGTINVGSEKDRHKQQEIIFHEVAHHIEFSLPQELKDLTTHFVLQKADGQIKSLRELTSDNAYEKDEMAYPDKFVHPYVGKKYPNSTHTEVLSMGLEHFANIEKMRQLYEADPDHFAFMLGMLKAMKERRQ